jgi:thymidylate kinase
MIKIGRIIGLYPFVTIPMQDMLAPEALKFPGYPWLLREVCTARDRYLMYHRARRLASNGSIVICDRFPLVNIKLMDGIFPVDAIANLFPQKIFVRNLARIVNRYYQSILLPELLIILRVDPDVAVQRKVDEDETFVRARTSEIWNSHFHGTKTLVINANQDKQVVLSKIREIIWSEI